MIVIKNREDLKREASNFPSDVAESIEFDVKIIEDNYDYQSDEYGPLIIVIDENEYDKMFERFPVITTTVAEDYYKIYEDENILVERTCYIISDEGFAVYVFRKKNNV